MTKLSYYKAVDQDDENHLLYGSSKKQIHLIGESINAGPFKEVDELVLSEIKSDHDEKALAEAREKYKVYNKTDTTEADTEAVAEA